MFELAVITVIFSLGFAFLCVMVLWQKYLGLNIFEFKK